MSLAGPNPALLSPGTSVLSAMSDSCPCPKSPIETKLSMSAFSLVPVESLLKNAGRAGTG